MRKNTDVFLNIEHYILFFVRTTNKHYPAMFLSRHLEENCCYTSISSEHSEVGHPDQHLYSALRAQLTVEENFAAVQASAVNTLRWAASLEG